MWFDLYCILISLLLSCKSEINAVCRPLYLTALLLMTAVDLAGHVLVVVCVPVMFHVGRMIQCPTSRHLLSRQISCRYHMSLCSSGTWMIMKLDASVTFVHRSTGLSCCKPRLDAFTVCTYLVTVNDTWLILQCVHKFCRWYRDHFVLRPTAVDYFIKQPLDCSFFPAICISLKLMW